MKNHSFASSFWISFMLSMVVFVLGLHFFWAKDYRKLPPALPLNWGKSYVASYDSTSSDGLVDYHLYDTGIFGFGPRIRAADFLLFGNSHVMFGLSAGQLEDELSAKEGHPVKVFNLGRGGSNMAMVNRSIQLNGARNQTAVMDTFNLNPDLPLLYPKAILDALSWHETHLQAYVQVSKCWSEFGRDWLLDRFLPKLRIGRPWGESPVSCQRFLGYTHLRDFHNGDTIALWHPNQGFLFPEREGAARHPIKGRVKYNEGIPDDSTGGHFRTEVLEERHIRPVYTLIPYDGYQLGSLSDDAKPFISIAAEGLLTWDGSHLTAESRRVATERLFEGLVKLGVPAGSPLTH